MSPFRDRPSRGAAEARSIDASSGDRRQDTDTRTPLTLNTLTLVRGRFFGRTETGLDPQRAGYG